MSKIWAVVKDPGGTNAVLPVIKGLRAANHEIRLFSNGAAVKILTENKLFHEPADAEKLAELVKDFERQETRPDIILSSICSDGGLGRQLIIAGKKAGIPTVAVQDFWGAQLKHAFADPGTWPKYILVPDVLGEALVRDAWNGYSGDIIVTGWIAFDQLVKIDSAAKKENFQNRFDLKNNHPIVVFSGQIERSSETLFEVVAALNELGRSIYFVPRWHYRVSQNPFESWCSPLVANQLLKAGTLVDTNYLSAGELPPHDVIAAADIVLSMFSTELIVAAHLRKPAISVLYSASGQAEYERLTGFKEFPLVTLGCAAIAKNRDELKKHVLGALNGDLGLFRIQEQYLPCDGKSAERAVESILNILRATS